MYLIDSQKVKLIIDEDTVNYWKPSNSSKFDNHAGDCLFSSPHELAGATISRIKCVTWQ